LGSVLDPTIPIDVGERSQRQRIVEAMVECCAEKTYAATTIADIVSEASISRTTFYKRFSGKRECFDAALDWCLEEMQATALASVSSSDSAVETVRKAATATLQLMAANPALTQLLTAEAVSVDPAVLARFRQVLIPALEKLWSDSGQPRQGQIDPRFALGKAQVLIYNHAAAGKAARLPELLPEILYIALLPFLGHEGALNQALQAGDATDAELASRQ